MALQARTTTPPVPISFAPSQTFEGNDGPWSTFAIRVGTPAQVFHVLISTISEETLVPVPEGCLSTDPSNCGVLRGAEQFNNVASSGFQVNSSSTWSPINLYELGLDANLNYTGNGEYGFDTVGLQLPQSGGPTLSHQIVAGIAAKDFFLGSFGLGPKPTNFTDFNNPQPSYIWSLNNQSMIPSLSYGYTAGAQYRLKQVPGSLTLGGYDSSRFTRNNISFSFSADDSRPLTLGIQSIQAVNTLLGYVSLLPSGILSLIDSTVPEIWLPVAACTIFEKAFGLTYDPNTDRYLVNDTIHSNLTSMNPTLTFKLGNDISGEDSIDISLPYNSFDLVAEWPIYANATNYFPLRRATNETQYTLGRTFLQEAYLIADYERSNFSVSQCVFKENNPSQIVAIKSTSAPIATSKKGLSGGAIAGIAVGIIGGLIIIFAGVWIFFQRRKKKQKGEPAYEQTNSDSNEEAMKESPPLYEVLGSPGDERPEEMQAIEVRRIELIGDDRRIEMAGDEGRREIGGNEVLRHKLTSREEVHELPAAPFER